VVTQGLMATFLTPLVVVLVDLPLPAGLELPDDETLKPVTEAVRALLGVLASGEQPSGSG
jgi:hypothetical protein